MVDVLTVTLWPKNLKAIHCGLIKRVANIFKRSITKSNLWYSNYIGDGHSSGFNTIKELKRYGDTIITKFQCVGYVQGVINYMWHGKGKNYPMGKASWVQVA